MYACCYDIAFPADAADPMKLYFSAFLLLILTACASGPRLDTSHPSVNFDGRVQYVIMHYTSTSMEKSLQLLTHGEVSSHYLIGDDSKATIYKLVDESARAWHAGESEWEGRTWLNSSSIGIEIVNPGFKDTPAGRLWYPYTEAQIQSITVLLKDIVKRNKIDPKHIIGHSDIAPTRKQDPGPLFPWKRLAAEGLGIWPDERLVAQHQALLATNLPSISWFQQQLARLGYSTPQTGELDTATRQVLAAFQMHYRPARFDGEPDAQSAAILQVLNRVN
ncbi:N-acetylmuramoyl-L-alanine amidase [Pseudomonas savastanoi pv. glycinea]|uniref:N-acetylmuramoyl-L-alanine amidase n=6 Tax=Pseudomonas syringae group TaxID=136849 RepID=A0A3M3G8D0_PSESG|nr:N-acetylmuramoyl-L-alanine amidase [Pseudomonas savastanoi pv. glycinea]RMM64744.1 N-acetylmuramoyl-L-alanine amidase [Pseudomonas savastanoi pv. glycinea]RMM69742.1 N-acetylmuramoyl-L-alanine amidase [Pseudomonas savastanoi pv. glycinea]RMO41292.1 N-acetylmuramoyl-L-alanine amidase [Pseudomonas savastanoi pv. glycinea]